MNDTLKPPGGRCDACAGYALTGPPVETEDPARHIGEIFRRLTLASETYRGAAFARIVAVVLVALGRACLVEAEAQARWLQERGEPARQGVRVSATARRIDFDGWDPGDPN
ncbi:hypothetical protein [Methylobacterium radiotolerans]